MSDNKIDIYIDRILEESAFRCGIEILDIMKRRIKKKIVIPNDEKLSKLAKYLSLLSNPIRLKIVFLLSQTELPVCIISSILGLEQSLVSHHLAVLRRANIVGAKSVGKYRLYYLKTNSLLENILNELS
ncbi:ArsR/SmtB family transcription factor [Staphylothermus hellenicus]|uniref:Transcriptional regulator, ArsR family n=1 Tax=Staphylothermus hellenicus (strain DSM 12710 / JCM 10830 / BK20S6-10-b1 / P8) TaxID=591019 RepID=D7D980_STAHD|nr:metalloregulator ArsR/SmtB family transcription factor [Staphylothermus hellenicus]ADI32326.1 transcriptional regulator, ArsR family [Staphylothermus hellenicus DSM 12710]